MAENAKPESGKETNLLKKGLWIRTQGSARKNKND